MSGPACQDYSSRNNAAVATSAASPPRTGDRRRTAASPLVLVLAQKWLAWVEQEPGQGTTDAVVERIRKLLRLTNGVGATGAEASGQCVAC